MEHFIKASDSLVSALLFTYFPSIDPTYNIKTDGIVLFKLPPSPDIATLIEQQAQGRGKQ
jgi:hypothetical protein